MPPQAALTLDPSRPERLPAPAAGPHRRTAADAALASPTAAARAEDIAGAETGFGAPRGSRWRGLAVVAALHVVLGWALLNGLAQRVVEVVRAPLETRIVQEEKKLPPPPEPLLPPPRQALPPPSFVPPPEVQVAPPPTPAPVITATPIAPPVPVPVTIAPPPAPVPAPAPPPVAMVAPPAPVGRPARLEVAGCARPDYPDAAVRVEATGTTKIRFTVDAAGLVSKAEVERPSGASREHRLLDRAAVQALSKCRFTPGTDDQGRAIGGFAVVDYVWKLD